MMKLNHCLLFVFFLQTTPIIAAANALTSADQTNPWVKLLQGRTLLHSHEKDGVAKKKYIDLCQNGSAHLRNREIFFSADATHQFSAANENKRSGHWQIDHNQLSLIWKDGPSTQFELAGEFDKKAKAWVIKLDQQDWHFSENSFCQ